MKTRFVISVVLQIISVNYQIVAQSWEDEVIEQLNNDTVYIAYSAALDLFSIDQSAAAQVALKLYDSKPPIIQKVFLWILAGANAPGTSDKIYDFINRADNFSNEPYRIDPLEAKVDATKALFMLKDYKTYQFVFEIIEREGVSNISSYYLDLTADIMNNVPAAEEKAKNILINALTNSDDRIRYFAISYLVEKYGDSFNDQLIKSFTSDKDLPVKIISFEYLCNFNYPHLHDLLIQRLVVEESKHIRLNIADTLLTRYGHPADLKLVMDYQPKEPDETIKSLMHFSIKGFIPPKPNTELPVILDSLISFIKQIKQYGWLSDSLAESYSNRLDLLKNSADDYEEFLSRLDLLINKTIADKDQNIITQEAYKFIYYYSIYMKEKIDEGIRVNK